jgi:glycerol uptake facilitator-like aquaporin
MDNDKLKAYAAEFIGTFALTFVGAGAIANGQAGLVGVALAHGVAIMTMIYALGHISGIHINPAVTVGVWLGGKLKASDAIAYIIAQVLGATVAGFLLLMVFGDPSVKTFFLVMVVWGAAVDGRTAGPAVGLAIGLTVTMDILMGGPITGAAVNPARYTGTAIAAGHLSEFYVYWIGPLLGGAVAGLLYSQLFYKQK